MRAVGAGSEPTGSEGRPGGSGAWRRAARWTLRLALTAGLTWVLFRQVDLSLERLDRIPEAWRDPDPVLLAASAGVLLAGFLLSVRNWTGIVRELGGRRMGLLEASQIFFTANLGRYVPGKVWQVAGLAYLAGRRRVSPTAATGGAVLGQGFTVLAATILGVTTLADGATPAVRLGPWPLVAAGVAVTILLFPSVLRRAVRAGFRLADRETPDLPDLGALFGVRWLLGYGAVWLIYGFAFWLLARSLGLEGGFASLTAVFAAAYAVGYLAVFAPAGLGVREGVLAALLAPTTGASGAVALSITARIWMTAVELLPALPLAARQLRHEFSGPESSGRNRSGRRGRRGRRHEPSATGDRAPGPERPEGERS